MSFPIWSRVQAWSLASDLEFRAYGHKAFGIGLGPRVDEFMV